MSKYVVVYEKAEEGGWGAYLPDVPGVVALGATRDDVTAGIREALDVYVDELKTLGVELPAPAAAVGTIEAA